MGQHGEKGGGNGSDWEEKRHPQRGPGVQAWCELVLTPQSEPEQRSQLGKWPIRLRKACEGRACAS